MRLGIFGGSFNPPHKGHIRAAARAAEALKLERLLIMPAGTPPHKALSGDSPSGEGRGRLCELAFAELPCAEISDLELTREGASYTADTLDVLRKLYPDDELFLLMGADMLEHFSAWYRFRDILEACTLAVFCREEGDSPALARAAETLGQAHKTRILRIPFDPVEISSTALRGALANREKPDALPEAVYEEIIRCRYYGARPNFPWLRQQGYACLKPKRVPHVQGTEEEAVRLAEHWGADPEAAAEAAILHDMTKKYELHEQLILCREYGIINDTSETENGKLLHAKTGAAQARSRFGVSEAVYNAIRWHTTGRAGMSLLEKIIYMADYIEPNRDFPGVDKLRALAYTDLDKAVILGLEMSMEDLRARGIEPHDRSLEALACLRAGNSGAQDCASTDRQIDRK